MMQVRSFAAADGTEPYRRICPDAGPVRLVHAVHPGISAVLSDGGTRMDIISAAPMGSRLFREHLNGLI